MKIIFEVRVEDDRETIISSINGIAEYNDKGQCIKTSCNSSSMGQGDKAKKKAKNVIRVIADTICECLVFKGKKD